MPIQCDIVTQERTVFSGEVDSVNLPGSEGRMGILPNHTALLTTLDFGEVVVRKGDQEEFFAIGGGFVEVQPDHVSVLARTAEHADEIDLARAEAARERAVELLRDGPPPDMSRLAALETALRRSNVRLKVARKRKRRPGPGPMMGTDTE